MPGTLIVTAFGSLLPNQRRSVEGVEEDLYSIFLARSMFMGWSRIGTSEHPPIPLLWDMNEADLNHDGGPQICFVQVGLADRGDYHRTVDEGPITEPVVAIPPLVRCVDDSLCWFGEVEVSAYEVTALDIEHSQTSHLLDLLTVADWFGDNPASPIRGVVTLASERRAERIARDIFGEALTNSGCPFKFGPLVNSPDDHATGHEYWGVEWETATTGVEVSMPEWSADAIGWIAARVAYSALSIVPTPQALSVRVSRLA